MASSQLTLRLSEITVLKNGRPEESPRPMQVGLVVQLRNPLRPDVPLASDIVSFTVEAGQKVAAAELFPDEEKHALFGKTLDVPDVYVLDFRFLVYYQNDMGPIIGAALNKLLDFVTGKIPMLPSEVEKHLHFKIGSTVAEEYGRQNVLGRVPFEGRESRDLDLDLVAPERIRGVYMKRATPTSAPAVSKPVTFIEEGETAARILLNLECGEPPETKPKPRPKAPARKSAVRRSR
ncbi:MAG: hypothetical protein IT186_14475 [Acidobacteria bacterium]|nr:hypothetical protein [Acidobacteriota bacterium]